MNTLYIVPLPPCFTIKCGHLNTENFSSGDFFHFSYRLNDFNYAPFSQRGGLGKAHQLFSDDLPKLLDELNEVLAA
jgi:hypothetical protein